MKLRPEQAFMDSVCQPFFFQGDDHGVLLLHGFTGSVSHMRPLGEALHRQGFTVEGINLPGHAVSMEAMGQTGWQDWLEAAKTAFLRLKERCRYVSVAGLSMGGCLTLLIGETMQPTAIAPIAAPMGAQNRLLPLAGIAAPFVPHIMWTPRNDAPDSPAALDQRYDHGYPGFPTKCGADLYRLMRMARQDLHAVSCPVLVVQSHQDETITRNSADIITRGVSSEQVGMLWLEDVPHVCTISMALPQIAQAVGDLFRSAEGKGQS